MNGLIICTPGHYDRSGLRRYTQKKKKIVEKKVKKTKKNKIDTRV